MTLLQHSAKTDHSGAPLAEARNAAAAGEVAVGSLLVDGASV